jgi:hypothetical protein
MGKKKSCSKLHINDAYLIRAIEMDCVDPFQVTKYIVEVS